MRKIHRTITIDQETDIQIRLRGEDINVSKICNAALKTALNINKENNDLEQLQQQMKELEKKTIEIAAEKASIKEALTAAEEERKRRITENMTQSEALAQAIKNSGVLEDDE